MRARFEDMTLFEVQQRTANEGQAQRGKPVYFNRPWTQLHDEMRMAEVKKVGDLPAPLLKSLRATIVRSSSPAG